MNTLYAIQSNKVINTSCLRLKKRYILIKKSQYQEMQSIQIEKIYIKDNIGNYLINQNNKQ